MGHDLLHYRAQQSLMNDKRVSSLYKRNCIAQVETRSIRKTNLSPLGHELYVHGQYKKTPDSTLRTDLAR